MNSMPWIFCCGTPLKFTDWQKELIGGTASFTNISAGISGGSELTKYLVRTTYQRESTVFPSDFDDRKSSIYFSINNTSANQRFNFQFSGTYLDDNNHLPYTDLTNSIFIEPDAPALYNSDGTLNWMPNAFGNSTWNNPLASLNNTYQNRTANLLGNAVLTYKVLKGLEFRTSIGYNDIRVEETQLNPLTSIRPEDRIYSQRYAGYGHKNIRSWIFEPQITYEKDISKGKLNWLLGSTLQQNRSNAESIYGFGYNTDQDMENILAAASLSASQTFASEYKYTAIFSRLNYNWDQKYVINFTARRDGSSRFGNENQFGNFYSFGAGWIFSEENLFKQKVIFSFGKLRASYGIIGSDQLADYQFMSLYKTIDVGVPYQGFVGLMPSGIPNPYLEWELTRKLQIGLELGFLRDRILLNTTFARNRSSNLLTFYPLPLITGNDVVSKNFPGTIQNTNWEISATANIIKSSVFSWTTSTNLTIPRNKLVTYPNLESSPDAQRLIIGQDIGIQKVLSGIAVDPVTGNYKVNSKTDPFNPVFPDDFNVLVRSSPKYYGGMQNSFSYRNIQLDFLFQFVNQIAPGIIFNNGNGSASPGRFVNGQSNQPITVLDRWQKQGDIAPIQKFSSRRSNLANALTSEVNFMDASYIRLKNISLSWQIPKEWKTKIRIQVSPLRPRSKPIYINRI